MPRPTLTPTFKPREPMTAEDRAYNIRMNPANQRQWIDKLTEQDPAKFDAFERRYIQQMDMLLKQGMMLTGPQASRLEQIYTDNTD